jgi:AraC-like DNA-binding protein
MQVAREFGSTLATSAASRAAARATASVRPAADLGAEHLADRLTVEELAGPAGMSARHFTRAFIAETGSTPSKAIERLRIEAARARVQSSSEAIERGADNGLRRSRAHAPRLRPAASIAVASRARGVIRTEQCRSIWNGQGRHQLNLAEPSSDQASAAGAEQEFPFAGRPRRRPRCSEVAILKTENFKD